MRGENIGLNEYTAMKKNKSTFPALIHSTAIYRDEKPVGLVHMAAARAGRETLHQQHIFDGNRDDVRRQTVAAALRLVLDILK